MPSLFKRSNGRYYICYEEDGKKKWKSTGKFRKDEAYKEMMQFETHLRTYRTRMTLQQFAQELLSHAQVNYAPSTQEMYARSLKLFQALAGNKYVSAVTAKDADNFRTFRAKQVSPVSVNIELRTLKASFTLAMRWKLISENPFRGIAFMKIPEQQPAYIRKEDFGRLILAISDQWFKDIVTFAVLTGMRRSEIINLKWKDVDFGRRLLHVENSATFTTKTGKRRSVPMNESVYQLLWGKSVKSAEGIVFTFQGQQIRLDLLTRKFRFCVRRAGLNREIHFHSLRHTFATWLVQGSVSIYEVQKLLGHSSITVTQVYSHLASSELHSAVDTLVLSDNCPC